MRCSYLPLWYGIAFNLTVSWFYPSYRLPL
nr:MAG TPA: hypothetical protein [Caudoviricetes sp.]